MTPRDYALMAQRAYDTPPQIGVESSAARAIVEGNAVAFPGSNNIACWLADLDVNVIFVPGMGGLHAGFWRALQSIRDPLLALPSTEVTVGHSEGAALAILFAALLCKLGKPPKAVYGFEPPRVSIDPVLSVVLNTNGVKVNLYRNGEDVVPLVPRILHPWQHPAPIIAIGHASLPVPNVEDHKLGKVVEALT